MNDWAALLTPPLPGAISVWGVRGPEAWQLMAPSLQALRGSNFTPQTQPRHARLARWNMLPGSRGDEVLVIPRKEQPFPWFEIHGHSGPELLRCQSRWLATHGFRIATPKSFVSWVEADRLAGEVLGSLGETVTRRGAEGVLKQSGLCRFALSQCCEWLDNGRWKPCLESLTEMAKGYLQAKGWTSGWKVALCGPPNAGKSSLLNALVGTGRSIVSSMPGTTRDAVRARTVLDGWVVEFVDTAGWRQSEDPLELAGINLGKGLIGSSDLLLLLSENAKESWGLPALAGVTNAIPVWTKSDLRKCDPAYQGPALEVSAQTGQGIEGLAKRIVDKLTDNGNLPKGAAAISAGLAEDLLLAADAVKSGLFDAAGGIIKKWLEPIHQPTEIKE